MNKFVSKNYYKFDNLKTFFKIRFSSCSSQQQSSSEFVRENTSIYKD